MSILNIGTNVQISGVSAPGQPPKITGVLSAPGIIPTGAVIYTASNTGTGTPVGSLPPGYLPCDGAAYDKLAYPELYDAIRDTFNSNASLVNPATGAALAQPPAGFFRVPMLQGLFVRCWDGPSFTSIDPVNSGRIFGSYQVDDFKSHTHPVTSLTAGLVSGTRNFTSNLFTTTSISLATNATGGTANANITLANSQTFPRNLALFAIIKY